MRPILYTLTSSLHGEMAPDPRQEPFIRELEEALGTGFDCRGDDFSSFAGAQSTSGNEPSSPSGNGPTGESPALIYIRTGGTEGLFLGRLRAAGLIPGAPEPDSHPGTGKGPVFRLLASGQSNSLAASMEILSWQQQRGISGEILHGSSAALAARIRSFAAPGIPENGFPGTEEVGSVPGGPKNGLPGTERADFVPGGDLTEEVGPEVLWQAQDDREQDKGKRILEGKRFGVIGRPSDWLISSGVDYAVARERLGAELIDIPIEELVAEAPGAAAYFLQQPIGNHHIIVPGKL